MVYIPLTAAARNPAMAIFAVGGRGRLGATALLRCLPILVTCAWSAMALGIGMLAWHGVLQFAI